jgi:cytochrome P450
MAYSIILGVLLALLIPVILQLLYRRKRYYSAYNLPPGNLGVPIIGTTFSLLRAFGSNTDDQWFRDRIKKYGPVSIMSLLGSPTVLLAGPAANHFIFSNDGLILTQTTALRTLVGRSVLTLTGNELKQVRTALQGFLRPDRVRRYMSKMDDEVRRHIELNWVGRDSITVCAKRFHTCFCSLNNC